jgi:hypothetical protein
LEGAYNGKIFARASVYGMRLKTIPAANRCGA